MVNRRKKKKKKTTALEKTASSETELYRSPEVSHIPACRTAEMMTDSKVVDRPVLEDVAEEEDLFAAAGSGASGCCQVSMWRWFTFHYCCLPPVKICISIV